MSWIFPDSFTSLRSVSSPWQTRVSGRPPERLTFFLFWRERPSPSRTSSEVGSLPDVVWCVTVSPLRRGQERRWDDTGKGLSIDPGPHVLFTPLPCLRLAWGRRREVISGDLTSPGNYLFLSPKVRFHQVSKTIRWYTYILYVKSVQNTDFPYTFCKMIVQWLFQDPTRVPGLRHFRFPKFSYFITVAWDFRRGIQIEIPLHSGRTRFPGGHRSPFSEVGEDSI